MKSDIDAALDQCLSWQREGRSVEACLSGYPQFAEELRPLLQLAADVRLVQTPEPDMQARVRGRQQVLSTLVQRRDRTARGASRTTLHPGALASALAAWVPRLRRVPSVAVATILVVVTAFTVAASADTVPGDALYPLKVAGQELQVALTVRSERRSHVQQEVQTRRRQDVQAALERGRQATVTFQGLLQSVSDGTWVVGGLPVEVSADTQVVGDPEPGDWVEVRAVLPGSGALVAVRLSELTAPWELMPGRSTEELGDPEERIEDGTSEDEQEEATPGGRETGQPHGLEDDHATPEGEDEGEEGPAETPHGDDHDEPEEIEGTPTAAGWASPPAMMVPEETEEHREQTPHPHETPEPEASPEPTERPEAEDGPEATEAPEPDEAPEEEETPEAHDGPGADHGEGASFSAPPR